MQKFYGLFWLLCSLLTGCGQAGPLYMPPATPTPIKPVTVTVTSTPQTTEPTKT